MTRYILLIFIVFTMPNFAQNASDLPYYEIPKAAESYTAGAVASRMLDGLGFRFYWATEGLSAEDLNYAPSATGRTSEATVTHILELSNFILSTLDKDAVFVKNTALSFTAKRAETLQNIQKASSILRASKGLSEFDHETFKFWNIINGPISDALWHCGQIVMLRRASGNPVTSKIELFTGTIKK